MRPEITLLKAALFAWLGSLAANVAGILMKRWSAVERMHYSVWNLHEKCKDTAFSDKVPIPCAELSINPPSYWGTMMVREVASAFSMCGVAQCSDVFEWRNAVVVAVGMAAVRMFFPWAWGRVRTKRMQRMLQQKLLS